MSEIDAFEWLCEELERRTDFSRIEARGTVRIAVKQNGLIVGGLTSSQVGAILEHVLPAELESRGIERAEEICREIGDALKRTSLRTPIGLAPDVVFARLGG